MATQADFDGPRFCPGCGTGLLPAAAPHRAPRCPACGYVFYRSPIVGVAVVLVDSQGLVLMGRRAFGRYAGTWCIPCGVLEWGEDVREGAARECLEETGLEVEVGDVLAVHNTHHLPAVVGGRSYPERQAVGIWFRGQVKGGSLHPSDGEMTELAYVDPLHPPQLAFAADRLVLQQIAREQG